MSKTMGCEGMSMNKFIVREIKKELFLSIIILMSYLGYTKSNEICILVPYSKLEKVSLYTVDREKNALFFDAI
jgi:hypothetical protein